jgi:ABC-type multidrug transport system ATPase subunit
MTNLNGLQLDAGFIGVLGTRGAGKTRLLRQLAEQGCSHSTSNEAEQKVCYVSHELQPYESLTVTEYLIQVATDCGIDKNAVAELITGSIEQVNLTRFADHPIGELSSLLKSQTLLAKALLCEPQCLLLDEVLGGLNENERMSIGFLLNEMGKERVVVLAGDVTEPVDGLFDSVCLLHPEKDMVQVSANTAYSWVEGKVWEYIVPELPDVAEGRIITAVKQTEDGVYVREIAQHVPFEEVSQVSPTLTDAYYWWAAQR